MQTGSAYLFSILRRLVMLLEGMKNPSAGNNSTGIAKAMGFKPIAISLFLFQSVYDHFAGKCSQENFAVCNGRG